MFAAALALAIVGGWGGGSPMQFASSGQNCVNGTCYRQVPASGEQMFSGQRTLVYDGPTQTRREPAYAWHPIEHEGLHFQVWGYIGSDGKCKWQPKLEENRANWARAVEAAKATLKPESPDINLTGIDPTKFAGKSDSYTATSNEAKQFVGGIKSVEDDPGKIHVTVIGEEADCAQVMSDLNDPAGAFSAVRSQLFVADFRPKEWQVDPGLGFPIHGKPAILIQTAKGPGDPKGGGVIYRANDYSAGPKGMVEAIRKVNPLYKPDQDPGPATGKNNGDIFAFAEANSVLIVSVFLACALMMLPPKRKVS